MKELQGNTCEVRNNTCELLLTVQYSQILHIAEHAAQVQEFLGLPAPSDGPDSYLTNLRSGSPNFVDLFGATLRDQINAGWSIAGRVMRTHKVDSSELTALYVQAMCK